MISSIESTFGSTADLYAYCNCYRDWRASISIEFELCEPFLCLENISSASFFASCDVTRMFYSCLTSYIVGMKSSLPLFISTHCERWC